MLFDDISKVQKQADFAFICRVALALKLRQEHRHIWLKTQET